LKRFPVLALLAGAALVGCDGPWDRTALAARVSPRSMWKATGNLDDPPKAIDGKIGTVTVGGDSGRPAYLTIDLGKVCLFNMIAVDHGAEEMGFCRRLAVGSSLDGKTFTDHYIAVGTRRITTICLQSPVLARYIRLRVLASGGRPWAVAEVYVQ